MKGIKIFQEKRKMKVGNMVAKEIKIFQKMKKKGSLTIAKNIAKIGKKGRAVQIVLLVC